MVKIVAPFTGEEPADLLHLDNVLHLSASASAGGGVKPEAWSGAEFRSGSLRNGTTVEADRVRRRAGRWGQIIQRSGRGVLVAVRRDSSPPPPSR